MVNILPEFSYSMLTSVYYSFGIALNTLTSVRQNLSDIHSELESLRRSITDNHGGIERVAQQAQSRSKSRSASGDLKGSANPPSEWPSDGLACIHAFHSQAISPAATVLVALDQVAKVHDIYASSVSEISILSGDCQTVRNFDRCKDNSSDDGIERSAFNYSDALDISPYFQPDVTIEDESFIIGLAPFTVYQKGMYSLPEHCDKGLPFQTTTTNFSAVTLATRTRSM